MKRFFVGWLVCCSLAFAILSLFEGRPGIEKFFEFWWLVVPGIGLFLAIGVTIIERGQRNWQALAIVLSTIIALAGFLYSIKITGTSAGPLRSWIGMGSFMGGALLAMIFWRLYQRKAPKPPSFTRQSVLRRVR